MLTLRVEKGLTVGLATMALLLVKVAIVGRCCLAVRIELGKVLQDAVHAC